MPSQTTSMNGTSCQTFYHLEDPTILISILTERLPISVLMYNQVLQFKNFTKELKFFTIGKEVNSDTWILSNNIREDYGSNYTISAPKSMANGEKEIPDEIKKCFLNGGPIDWDNFGDVVFFTQSPKSISTMILDLSANEKGQLTEVHPCYLYMMEREDALKLEISNNDPKVEIRRLDVSKNEENFLLETWKYTLPGSEIAIRKCVERNASGGVFVDGKCVAGVYIPTYDFLSALYTLREFRKHGYAKLVMNYTFKEYAKDGHIPCLTVELPNTRAIKFHESLGLKRVAQVNGILVKKLEID